MGFVGDRAKVSPTGKIGKIIGGYMMIIGDCIRIVVGTKGIHRISFRVYVIPIIIWRLVKTLVPSWVSDSGTPKGTVILTIPHIV